MESKTRFPVLEGKIAERGLLKKNIADTLNISQRALSNKLNGKSDFTWREVVTMQSAYFSDVTKEELMTRTIGGESA